MTQEETEAHELFDGLVKQIPMDMTIPAFRRWEIRKKAAKDCAIFSVNRYINDLKLSYPSITLNSSMTREWMQDGKRQLITSRIEFWEKVKTHIQEK